MLIRGSHTVGADKAVAVITGFRLDCELPNNWRQSGLDCCRKKQLFRVLSWCSMFINEPESCGSSVHRRPACCLSELALAGGQSKKPLCFPIAWMTQGRILELLQSFLALKEQPRCQVLRVLSGLISFLTSVSSASTSPVPAVGCGGQCLFCFPFASGCFWSLRVGGGGRWFMCCLASGLSA